MSDYLTRMVERALCREPAVRPLVPPACLPTPAEGPPSSPLDEEVFVGTGDKNASTPPGKAAKAASPIDQQPKAGGRWSEYSAGSVEAAPEVMDSSIDGGIKNEKTAAFLTVAMQGGERGGEEADITAMDTALPGGPAPEALHDAATGPGFPPVMSSQPRANEATAGIFKTALQLMERERQPERELLLMDVEQKAAGMPRETAPAEPAIRLAHDPVAPLPERRGGVTPHEREQLFMTPDGAAAVREEPSSPVIRVSIGRVEIRHAVPQNAPAEPRPSPMPKVSLDEYLRKQPGRTR